MRIGMGYAARRQQLAGLGERLGDDLVGRPLLARRRIDQETREQRHMRIVAAVLGDRVGHFHAVGDAELVVVGAVARRDVHEARAGVGGDEVARQQADVELEALAAQRMGRDQPLEILGRHVAQHLGREVRRLGHCTDEILRQHHLLSHHGTAALAHGHDLDQRVGDVGSVGQRAVARHGPGRGGPDHYRGTVQLAALRPHDGEAHMHGVGGVVVILDLGLGQRGLLDHAPQHRLGALVEPAVHQELAELVGDHGFRGIGHGRVVMVPVALDAQPLELLALHADPVVGEGAAFAAELADGDRILVHLLGAILLLDLPFDRQAVAVPARDVVAVLAQHLLGAGHQVLQDLVERVADMEIPVGIRGPVMEHELRPALALGAQPVEQLHVRPALQELGLLLGQAAAHGKVGLGQEDAGFVISCHEELGSGGSENRPPVWRSPQAKNDPAASADRADNSLPRGPDKHRAGNLGTGVRRVKAEGFRHSRPFRRRVHDTQYSALRNNTRKHAK